MISSSLSHSNPLNNKNNNIVHILPKANEIVITAEQQLKAIYPFSMKRSVHAQYFQDQAIQKTICYSDQPTNFKFAPPKLTVKQHFSKRNIVYDKFNNNFDDQMFNTNIFSVQKLKNLKNNDFIMSNLQKTPDFNQKQYNTSELVFDSRFQCGNLSLVSKIDGIFCLLLHNDVNTTGYTNWFYFKVTPKKIGSYKFAIMNYGKAGWAFNQGVRICIKMGETWHRKGLKIHCQANHKLYKDQSQHSKFNTLYFQFEFTTLQQVHFAYNIPYSYTDLLLLLDQLEEMKFPYFHRKLAGTSIAGNRIQSITIANFQKTKNLPTQQVPAIILMGRAHAGQTVSSWILHYFLKFLVGQSVQARTLRDKFVFKIFPMLNPDGVIHGNYRCSLMGRDLNRRWTKYTKQMFPQVYYVKNQIIQMSQKKPIKMILDFHGHTQKRQSFFFGCNDKNQPHKCRLFPYLASKISQRFQFNFCNFFIQKSKLSTARVSLFTLLKVSEVFTIQTSQFGFSKQVLNVKQLKQISQALMKAIYFYFKLHQFKQYNIKTFQRTTLQRTRNSEFQLVSKVKQLQEDQESVYFHDPQQIQNAFEGLIDPEAIEKQFFQNPTLHKVGNQMDDGSDSQPSVCNINLQNLNKMCRRKDLNINSEAVRNKYKNNINKIFRSKSRQTKIKDLTKQSICLVPSKQPNTPFISNRFASTSHSYRQKNTIQKSLDQMTQSRRTQRATSSNRQYNGKNAQLLCFDGFNNNKSKNKHRESSNPILNSILEQKINNYVHYTQPSSVRPSSYYYRNAKKLKQKFD